MYFIFSKFGEIYALLQQTYISALPFIIHILSISNFNTVCMHFAFRRNTYHTMRLHNTQYTSESRMHATCLIRTQHIFNFHTPDSCIKRAVISLAYLIHIQYTNTLTL